MRPTQLLLLVTLSVIWGSAFMMVDVILDDVPVMTLVAGRVTGGCLFLTSALLLTGRAMPRDFATWQAIIFLGLVNNCSPFIMLAWGQPSTAALRRSWSPACRCRSSSLPTSESTNSSHRAVCWAS